MLVRTVQVLQQKFPDFNNAILNAVTDQRDNRGQQYDTKDLIYSAFTMFYFKDGSRNAYNANLKQSFFKRTIERALNVKLVHGDTFDAFFRLLPSECLHELKVLLLRHLIESKTLAHFKVNGKYTVSIDGTGLGSYEDNTTGNCLKKTSKKGVTTYSKSVLEAKIVGSNGFALSICSEWISNENEEYQKQDCENRAFKRLIEKMKKDFPRLPIVITVDALFISEPFIAFCKKQNYDFVAVQKDNFYKYAKEETELRPDITTIENKNETHQYLNNIDYNQNGDTINWFLYSKPGDYSGSWYTNIEINRDNIFDLIKIGRLRWKIENEGYNVQKNSGYALEHKYNRINDNAIQNYYHCLQIVCMIDQLVMLEIKIKKLTNGFSKKKLSEWCRNLLIFVRINDYDAQELTAKPIQFRYLE